jgi:hypothetical protein
VEKKGVGLGRSPPYSCPVIPLHEVFAFSILLAALLGYEPDLYAWQGGAGMAASAKGKQGI